jgi:hypothetical protein
MAIVGPNRKRVKFILSGLPNSMVSKGWRPLARSGARSTRKVWMRETTFKGRFADFFVNARILAGGATIVALTNWRTVASRAP